MSRRLAWQPVAHRTAPSAILAGQAAGRLPELLPVRYARMRASPFAFLRGAAAVMAADLRTLPSPGPAGASIVQLCGDAHLANFGAYASPEGNPVFDVTDFDETSPGPFAWDLLRLATSLVLAGREHGLPATECRALAARSARHYRRHLAHLAALPPLDAWQSGIDLADAIKSIDHHRLRRRMEKRLRAATEASLDQYDLVETQDGAPRLRRPDTTQTLPAYRATIDAAFAAYPATLQPHCADLVARYRLVDRTFKVVGIGSVGTFCAIGLFASAAGAPLLLQLKQAQPSVLATAIDGSQGINQGERVVIGQRRLQAQSDIFLGWTAAPIDGRDFYVRRLKDSRLSKVGAVIEADMLPFTAALCGRTLARAHGRAGNAMRLAASTEAAGFDDMIADFAQSYADQTELDHASFCRALDDGSLA